VNENGSQAQRAPDVSEEDFSNPLVNMDARPAECFHVCKFITSSVPKKKVALPLISFFYTKWAEF